jgi:type II secretory pathway predicted ATPase ExeA
MDLRLNQASSRGSAFQEQPFSTSTDPNAFFQSTAADEAAQALLSAIRRREGVVLVTGRPGVGKTILSRAVLEQLDSRTQSSFIADAALPVETLLTTLLSGFGVISVADRTPRAASRDDLAAALRGFLRSLSALGATALLVLDGAEDASREVLEAIESWITEEGELRLLQVVLVGRPSLVARLRRQFRAIDERVGTRVEVDPVPEREVDAYIAHQLALPNPPVDVAFDDEAVRAVARMTKGVPRAINVLCSRALAAAQASSSAIVTRATVRAATSDWRLESRASPVSSAVVRVVAAAALLVLALTGAAVSMMVFQDPAGRLLHEWLDVPRPPAAPAADLPQALTPAPPPSS